MTKEQIQEAYDIAFGHSIDSSRITDIKDFVQIGMQMAINGEVLYDEDGSILYID